MNWSWLGGSSRCTESLSALPNSQRSIFLTLPRRLCASGVGRLSLFWNNPTDTEVASWGSFPWEEEAAVPFQPVAERVTTRSVARRFISETVAFAATARGGQAPPESAASHGEPCFEPSHGSTTIGFAWAVRLGVSGCACRPVQAGERPPSG